MKITLASKNNYGNIQWYATDENVRMTHKRLTGRTTFTDTDCAAYAQLGHEVEKTTAHFISK